MTKKWKKRGRVKYKKLQKFGNLKTKRSFFGKIKSIFDNFLKVFF